MSSYRPVIAWDNSLAGRNATGTGVYSSRLLAEFARRTSVELHVLSGWAWRPQGGGLLGKIVRNAADVLWVNGGLLFALRARQVDLLHVPAFIAPMASPCAMIVTVFDTAYLRFPDHYSRWGRFSIQRSVAGALRRASAVITISEHSKSDIARAYGIPPQKIRVTHLGVDHSRYHPSTGSDIPSLSTRYGLRDGYILHVGALVRRKNIPLLLRSVALLKDRGKWDGRKVVLAGPASSTMPCTSEIIACIEELGLHDDVVMVGHVPDEALPSLYARAGVLAVPSLYEGFCLPLVESMAVGTPVVACESSCIPEVLGDAGLLVPQHDTSAFAEALFAATTNRSLREELRAYGLRRASGFSWERTATDTLSVYRDVLGSRDTAQNVTQQR